MRSELSLSKTGAAEMRRRNRLNMGIGKKMLVFGFLAALVSIGRAADYSPAVNRAGAFLQTEERGRDILSYIHFGADYHGHRYLRTISVDGAPNDFALVYRFNWEDDGITDAAFLCNSYGSVYGVQIMYTNAVFSQPFLAANASIAVLGHGLIELYKDKLSDEDRRQLHKFVNDADAKGLLKWSLRLQQLVQ